MQMRGRQATPAADRTRLTVLTLLLAGFLSLHGFFAVATTAEAHAPAPSVAAVHAMEQGVDAGTADGEPATSASSHHAPLDPDDVLTGCIVALVGAALIALGAPSWVRRRSRFLRRVERRAASPHHVVASTPVRGQPPRIALCVIRV